MIIPFWHDRPVGVTGAHGFIGSHLCAELENLGARVVPLNARSENFPEEAAQCSVIFHLAAQTSVPAAEQNPEADFESNVLPMVRLLERVRSSTNPVRIVFASTATVIGMTDSLAIDQDQRPQPITMYDEHKWMAEQALAAITANGESEGVSLRLTNVYGPGVKSSGQGRGFASTVISRFLHGEPVTLYDDGAYLRDFVFVEDVVAAFLAAAEGWNPAWQPYYFVGSGRGATLRQFAEQSAKTVYELTGKPSAILSAEAPADLHEIDRRHFVADIRPFHEASHWQPAVFLEEGVARTVHFLAGTLEKQ